MLRRKFHNQKDHTQSVIILEKLQTEEKQLRAWRLQNMRGLFCVKSLDQRNTIKQRGQDGYINVTDLVNATGTSMAEYCKTEAWSRHKKTLSRKRRYPLYNERRLVIDSFDGECYIHPLGAIDFAMSSCGNVAQKIQQLCLPYLFTHFPAIRHGCDSNHESKPLLVDDSQAHQAARKFEALLQQYKRDHIQEKLNAYSLKIQ